MRIFISYRRDDSGILTGRLFDRLSSRFGPGNVFLDTASIGSGVEYPARIGAELRRATVVIAVIGEEWVGDNAKTRRIDDPNDFVRMELETALNMGRPILPIYVNRAPFVREDLPPSLQPLAERAAVEIEPSVDFDDLTNRLVRDIWRLNDTSLSRRVRARAGNFWLHHGRALLLASGIGIAIWAARDWVAATMLSDTGLIRALARHDPMAFQPGRSGTAHVGRMFVDRRQLIEETNLVDTIGTCSSTLDLFAITGRAFLNNHAVLQAASKRGVKIRVLLLDHGPMNSTNIQQLYDLSNVDGLKGNWATGDWEAAVLRLQALGIEVKVWRGPLRHTFWIRDGADPTHALGHVELVYFGDLKDNSSFRVGAFAAPLVQSLQTQFDYMWNLTGVAVAPQ